MTVIRNMLNKCVRQIEKKYASDKEVAHLVELLNELHKVNSTVQVRVTELRKVSMRSILKSVPRAIRDLSIQLNKETDFIAIGDELRIDTSIAEIINNSIIHIIRNSLDHGLELPEERIKAGKSRRGKITVCSAIRQESVVIEMKDDGRGLNRDAIRKKLLAEKSYTLEQVNAMDEDTLLATIFEAGFSTASQVTDISGRGIGMSMVKSAIESAGGHIEIESEITKGATFRMIIPIPKSVVIIDCLFVRSGGYDFGIPQDKILRVLRIEPERLSLMTDTLQGVRTLRLHDAIIPIVNLAESLCINHNESQKNLSLIVVQSGGQTFALGVDEVLDVEDTVVKSAPGPLKSSGLFMGATFLEEGKLGLIINIEGIATRAGIEPIKNASLSLSKSQDITQKNDHCLVFGIMHKQTEMYGLHQKDVFRIEDIDTKHIASAENKLVTKYRGGIMHLHDLTHGQNISLSRTVIVTSKMHDDIYYGLIVDMIFDIRPYEKTFVSEDGASTMTLIDEKIVTLVDLSKIQQGKPLLLAA